MTFDHDDRKRLTEFCPEIEDIKSSMDIASMYRDMLIFFALVKRLRETGKWVKFEDYADDQRIVRTVEDENFSKKYYSLTDWLLDPARFCELVAGWLKDERDDRLYA